MIVQWLALGPGYTFDSFWDQTPRSLWLAFKSNQLRSTREHNERMQHAWHVAAMQRSKKLPKLKTLLAKIAEHQSQPWQEQREVMRLWMSHLKRVNAHNARIRNATESHGK